MRLKTRMTTENKRSLETTKETIVCTFSLSSEEICIGLGKEIIPIISEYKENLTCYFSVKTEMSQKFDKEILVTHDCHFIIIIMLLRTHPIFLNGSIIIP